MNSGGRSAMEHEDWWEDFDIRIGPFGFGFGGWMRNIRYTRTQDSHILRIRIPSDIRKEEIKARLVKPGLLEIEWPRKIQGEDIPID